MLPNVAWLSWRSDCIFAVIFEKVLWTYVAAIISEISTRNIRIFISIIAELYYALVEVSGCPFRIETEQLLGQHRFFSILLLFYLCPSLSLHSFYLNLFPFILHIFTLSVKHYLLSKTHQQIHNEVKN